MRVPSFQLLGAETLGNRAVVMQSTPSPSSLLEMSFLPTSPSPKKRPHHRRAGEEDVSWGLPSSGSTTATEDHRQEQKCISVDEKQPSRAQYNDDEESDDEANSSERAVPKLDESAFPPFCNDRICRVGGTGRSSRGIPGIPYMPQSPYRQQLHKTSPPSASRLSSNRGEQAPEEEQAKRHSEEVGAGSPSPVGIRQNASNKQDDECCDGSRVHRHFPPRKRPKQGVSEDETGQYSNANQRSESPHAGNLASKHGEDFHPTNNSTTASGTRIFRDNDGEDLRFEEEHSSSLSSSVSAGGRVFHSPRGSCLSHFVGLSASTIALPNMALLTLPNATIQHPPSSFWGMESPVPDMAGLTRYLVSAPPVAAAGSLRSARVAPDTSLLAAHMTNTNLVGVPNTAAVTAAYQQLLATRDQIVSTLASPAFGRETSWIHLLATTTDITANNQIHLQQEQQGTTGTIPPSCTNTTPSIQGRSHARLLPATLGDLGPPTAAPTHQLEDEHISFVRSAPGQSLLLGTTTIAPSLATTSNVSAQQLWQQAHLRLAQPGAGRSTTTSPTKEQLPEDGSRDDPDVHDYLVGQGGHGVHHIGNKRVRNLIQSLVPEFLAASRKQSPSTPPHESERSKLIRKVIQDVHDRGGTFLHRDSIGGKWMPLPDREIVRKITQRFNEEACGRPQQQKGKKDGKTSSSRAFTDDTIH